jgi:biofilm PGA synthesis N-glycosyltransferase PgaC
MWDSVASLVAGFSFYYPLFMAYLWLIGGVYYYFHWERREPPVDQPPTLRAYPPLSLIIPCHNEGLNLHDTIARAASLDYPDYEIIAVNDGSTDQTADILDALQTEYPKLRVLHLEHNQGKAMALRMGALASPHEFLVCIDGDAVLDRHALHWLVRHLVDGPRVAAITGNPRVRNRSTLLGKIQVGEFSSIIGLIKRAQRIYGRIFTVSGVVTAFRKSALQRVGFWSTDMVTEDIDISWRLQLDHWDIRYEPNALCWILMPETLRGLWRQRLRWAQGGAEVLIRYWRDLLSWRKRRMWPVCMEMIVSVVWAYVMTVGACLWLLGLLLPLPTDLQVASLLPPRWSGVLLGLTCLLQFTVSLRLDGRYEQRSTARYYYWIIWYPLVYWLLNMVTSVVSLPKALLKRRGQRAVWKSPDRGLHQREQQA